MEDNFKIRSCIEILANDIKINKNTTILFLQQHLTDTGL